MQISVITVNLNNAQGLRRTLSSISAQKHRPELIVVDGGSTDDSLAVIKQFESLITCWSSEKDSGIYDAMNKGIRKAGGDYLLFLNSGDVLHDQNVLDDVLPQLTEDIVYGDLRFDDGQQVTSGHMPDRMDLEHLLKDTLWHPAAFIKAGLFTKYGLYDTSFRICGDYDFFFRTIVAQKVSTKHINKYIAIYDLHGVSSDLSNHPAIKEEKLRAQRKYLGSDFVLPRGDSPSFFSGILNSFRRWFR